MLTTKNVKTISDMRENAKALLDEANRGGPTYIFYRSKPQGVLLGLTEYNRLCDLAEDYNDSFKAQEYEKETKQDVEWVSHEDVLKELDLTS
ncbi:hypothetical protein CO051_07560 [Candidatus Roizmanbacteria bacterium CG_4_9_14_0_2_um_filter_39_13]|uniref:Antitoxin n=1 Tax=Candidatus Roizmanbacteria bacterium CG_4_9_14_0_2_um_filter_39_13 TaxID=1974839 RepID=A0A2M8EW33_9BACT|nr:MAG: hypothetical protein COY15_02695 [Candidatus Roizmanbacteria bacterium CG_4_10_14_0_2_um_filter_39_12]PJC30071.1 MAG: hypothetical protein CO051_07560 [Candidatus Roizmanbacteria bacterium CG_4_9_14_0_2_um_filter_39_13]